MSREPLCTRLRRLRGTGDSGYKSMVTSLIKLGFKLYFLNKLRVKKEGNLKVVVLKMKTIKTDIFPDTLLFISFSTRINKCFHTWLAFLKPYEANLAV